MKTKLNGILTLLLALVVQVAFAQQTVTGKVTDSQGLPILGATVLVKGSQNATTTDFDGNFSITAATTDALVFQYSGYDPKTVNVGNKSTINVTLSTSLDAVVVQAYRTTTLKEANIAASQLSAEDIVDRPNASVIQRLQGQVPGLSVQTSSGQPGGNAFIQLRGASSLNGNTEPLIIVDGVPVDEDAFATFNPNDVENIVTLVDGAATAIYGNRGANGVILITTKGGKYDSPLAISYSASTGFTEFIDTDYNRYDSRGLLRLEKRRGAGLGQTLTDAEIDAFAINTDWEKIFFQTGTNQSHNLSLRSGGSNLTQFTSVNYTEQESSLAGRTLQRMSFRTNVNGKSDNERFRFGTTTYMGFSDSRTAGADGSGSVFFNPIWAANNGLPYKDPNINTSEFLTGAAAFAFANAPYVNLNSQEFDREETDEIKIILGGDAAYDLNDDFTLRYRIGLDYTQGNNLATTSPLSALARVRAGSNDFEPFEGTTDQSTSRDIRFNSNLNLGWAKRFGEGTEAEKKHSVTANAYLEYVKGHFESFGFDQTGLDPRTFAPGDGTSFIDDNGNSDEVGANAFANKIETGLFSYFGNVSYDYDQKYGFEATVRRDKSFRFIENDGWGTFFSGVVRWNISEEDFLKDSETIDLLKLRVSYGEAGNDRITGGYYGALNNTRQLFATGVGYRDEQTFVPSNTVPVADLRWETVSTINVGIDYAFLNNRIYGNMELYNRVTDDLFAPQNISLVNPSSNVNKNVGSLRNNGATLVVNYDVIRAQSKGDFEFTVFANGTYNEDEILELSPEDGRIDNGGLTILQEGQRINEFFLVPYVGINPANGNLLFRDIDDNLTETIDNEDRRFNGKSLNPEFFGGFGFRAAYKNFFIETQFSYVTGTGFLDGDYENLLDVNFAGNGTLSADLERSWTPANRVTDIPALNATNLNPAANSDRFFVDSNFLRLRFAQIGYNLPQSLLDNSFLSSGRLYVTGENLLTFSDFRGSDPEQRQVQTAFDFPQGRLVGFGVDLNF
ncbi:SusC/RagA family TonB-linked outer membrane protein [Nonlabens antarcticus]|uniref:SusC/RagA family TonB-linked outer membrane protein n=1 Tax=Nonlabens antarcticus TaxID=392714 RepID=UPI001891B167|nr:SusC/RagA family TonB-linked outer membrane protein [Nonlabens antarcticus]